MLSGVGNTALVELSRLDGVPDQVRIFAKLESTNPGGSIKDRPVSRMIQTAVAENRFDGGRRLLDSSSGNAGIAYAMLGATLGIGVTLVVPGNASRERLDRIRAHGAELILTDPVEGYDHALREARRLAEQHEDQYFFCDQYTNDENWRAHFEGTGGEILAQLTELASRADAFVAGVGTGGTITGVGRRLREAWPDVHIAAVVPELFPGIEGLKPLGHPGDIVPAILDESLIDQRIDMTTEDSIATAKELARLGLYVGPSSGAFVCAARKLAQTGDYTTIVTVLSDTGERYASTGMWAQDPSTQ